MYTSQYQSQFLGGVIRPNSAVEFAVNAPTFPKTSSSFKFNPANYSGKGYTNYSWKSNESSLPLRPWESNTSLELANSVYPDGSRRANSAAAESLARENELKNARDKIDRLIRAGELNEAEKLQHRYFPSEIQANEIRGLQAPLRNITTSAAGHHAAALSQRAAILKELGNLAKSGLVSGGPAKTTPLTSVPGMTVVSPPLSTAPVSPSASIPSSSVPPSPALSTSSTRASPAVDVYRDLSPFVESKSDPSVPDTPEKLWDRAFSTIPSSDRRKIGEQMFEKLKTIADSEKTYLSSNTPAQKQLREAVAVSYLVKTNEKIDSAELKFILGKLNSKRSYLPATIESQMPTLVSTVLAKRSTR